MNEQTKANLVTRGTKLLNDYKVLCNDIASLEMYWNAVDGSTLIANADNLGNNVSGATFKTAMANLLGVLTAYKAGIATNVHKVIG